MMLDFVILDCVTWELIVIAGLISLACLDRKLKEDEDGQSGMEHRGTVHSHAERASRR